MADYLEVPGAEPQMGDGVLITYLAWVVQAGKIS